jgi:hypothetical protein
MSRKTETGTIQLGDKTFTVTAFTLDELEEMLPHFLDLTQPLNKGGFAAARAIVEAALKNQEGFLGVRTTIPEVLKAAGEIGVISGLARLGEAKAQESPET